MKTKPVFPDENQDTKKENKKPKPSTGFLVEDKNTRYFVNTYFTSETDVSEFIAEIIEEEAEDALLDEEKEISQQMM